MKVSECCGAKFNPDSDVCACCDEHSESIDQDKPSIIVMEMPPNPFEWEHDKTKN